jgi:hypothetical protein
MLDIAVRFPLLAFSFPSSAPDEPLSSRQPNDWSRHEHHQEKRCEEPSVSRLPHKDPPVSPRKSARFVQYCNRRSGQACRRFHQPAAARCCIEKRPSVNLHSVFLRRGCNLPDRMDLFQEPCGENWMHVDEITALEFYTIIRQVGWHFMWVLGSCSRRGFGPTQEIATEHAFARALKGIARRFNAAELVNVQATKVAGFYIAKVTLEPREVQQFSSLDVPAATHPQASPAG